MPEFSAGRSLDDSGVPAKPQTVGLQTSAGYQPKKGGEFE
jgi:hypothetical protein